MQPNEIAGVSGVPLEMRERAMLANAPVASSWPQPGLASSAHKRFPIGVIAARPDLLWCDPDLPGNEGFQRRPGAFERLARCGRVVAMRDRQPREGAAALLQRGQHVGRMPV